MDSPDDITIDGLGCVGRTAFLGSPGRHEAKTRCSSTVIMIIIIIIKAAGHEDDKSVSSVFGH